MNTFLIPFDTVENIFWNMRRRIPKSAIMFILMKQQEYYEKAEENTINETAFLNVVQYVIRELKYSDFNISKDIVLDILQEEEGITAQKQFQQYFYASHALN